ncbi:hypothetical protein AYO21_00640 [Fonsecaea monophora]|uniref:Xylanolytic transcriptional activator regulatory domain-containing protein n=1 Tax=Fonsecaea monophora TaxID=254056 RepID=A0A177FPL5_9EURO|nr:hypothetical protein AYO21_00640 [Fonsecaea monophora]KAH0840706.1 hypothetical protein FOPE_05729 [Fonsecaea pedrosoi]OAG45292.1 hypothetical protein AYO21_00640 [Fonsecaea monophora]
MACSIKVEYTSAWQQTPAEAALALAHQERECSFPFPYAQTQTQTNKTSRPKSKSRSSSRSRPLLDDDVVIPDFIKPLSNKVGEDDRDYLIAKGVFQLPTAEFQSIILQHYAEYVHPLLPLLDLSEVLDTVSAAGGRSDNKEKQVSLLLYWSILCAGLAATERQVILNHSYGSKAEVRYSFYKKAKVLFDLESELDRIVLCQSAVLLVSWSQDDHRMDLVHWIGVAISQAYSLKLHREEHNARADASAVDHLRRRIWWSVVMKECDVSLAMGYAPRIHLANVRMLNMQDFRDEDDAHPLKVPDVCSLSQITHQHRALSRDFLQPICVQKAKLAACVTRIFDAVQANSSVSSTDAFARSALAWQLDAELREWRSGLPRALTRLNTRTSLTMSKTDKTLALHWSTVEMVYWTAKITLHKSAASESETHLHAARTAAREITGICRALLGSGMEQHIPTVGVVAVLAAFSVHLRCSRSERDSERSSAIEELKTCVRFVNGLRDLNYTAQNVSRMIEDATREVELRLGLSSSAAAMSRVDSRVKSPAHASVISISRRDQAGAASYALPPLEQGDGDGDQDPALPGNVFHLDHDDIEQIAHATVIRAAGFYGPEDNLAGDDGTSRVGPWGPAFFEPTALMEMEMDAPFETFSVEL